MKHFLFTIALTFAVLTYAQQISAQTDENKTSFQAARSGINLEKTVYTTVEKNASLHPWFIVSSHSSGYSCVSTLRIKLIIPKINRFHVNTIFK